MTRWLDFFSAAFWRALFDVRLGVGGGGNGGGGTTRFEWNDALAPYWADTLSWASAAAKKPYEAAPEHVAGLNQDQVDAMGNIRSFAADPRYGVQNPNTALNHAIDQENATVSGYYLTGAGADPWATSMIQPSANSYIGENPYFQSMVKSGMGDIADAYARGTGAETARQFALSGTLGSSAHQDAISANQAALAKQLSQYATGMFGDQYNRSAQLMDSQLGRELQADTTNKTMGQQAYEAERERMLQALNPTQNEQQLALQRQQALMGVGDVQQQSQQRALDEMYQNWFNQYNFPQNQSAWLAGILSGAQGGLPPTQMTTQSAYGASPASSILGSALTAYGLFGSH